MGPYDWYLVRAALSYFPLQNDVHKIGKGIAEPFLLYKQKLSDIMNVYLSSDILNN